MFCFTGVSWKNINKGNGESQHTYHLNVFGHQFLPMSQFTDYMEIIWRIYLKWDHKQYKIQIDWYISIVKYVERVPPLSYIVYCIHCRQKIPERFPEIVYLIVIFFIHSFKCDRIIIINVSETMTIKYSVKLVYLLFVSWTNVNSFII